MLAEAEVSALSVFLLGLSLGLTACAVTCLPFIGTLAFGKAEGAASGLGDTAFFLGGRLLSYTLLGGLAGALGAWFVRELASGIGNLLIGLSSLFAAGWLIWPGRHRCGTAKRLNGLSPMLLGIGLTLIPCAPLATLLAAAAHGGSTGQGAWFGLLFGLGTLLTPMLVLIPAAAGLGHVLRLENAWLLIWLRHGAALVMGLLGMQRTNLFMPDAGAALLAITALIVSWKLLRQRRQQGSRRKIIQLHPLPAETGSA